MHDTIEKSFIKYVARFDSFQQRSMFGGTGLFSDESMYALIFNGVIFIRGGGELDKKFEALNCSRYQHVKRQCIATVNYFDVTPLFLHELGDNEQQCLGIQEYENKYGDNYLENIIKESITYAKYEKSKQQSIDNRRLRDLPNMQLTLERMVKKSGVPDVATFLRMKPEDIFIKVRATYGKNVDIRLLWKFTGAIEGCHWKLIKETRKQELLNHIR